MFFRWYIAPLLIICYWLSTTCYFHIILWIYFFYILDVATVAFVTAFFRCFCLIFILCSLEVTVSFTSFSFSSPTLSVLSPFLFSSIPNLTSLFFISITNSEALVLLSSSSDSFFTSCPSILLCWSSTFNLPNTFFSF